MRLLRTGSAFYAPAMCVATTVRSILLDARRVSACSVLLDGQFGIHGVCLGVPVVLGPRVQVLDGIALDPAQQAQLLANAQATKDILRSVLKYEFPA